MRLPKVKTKFPFWMWRWTGSDENLFELSVEERAIFALLAKEAA